MKNLEDHDIFALERVIERVEAEARSLMGAGDYGAEMPAEEARSLRRVRAALNGEVPANFSFERVNGDGLYGYINLFWGSDFVALVSPPRSYEIQQALEGQKLTTGDGFGKIAVGREDKGETK